jgi:class 3 adenylate cyclase
MKEQLGALLALPSADWRFISENVSRLVQGWEEDEVSQRLAALLRDSIDLAGFRRWFEAYASWNVQDLLPIVSTPTLLTCILDHPWFGPESVRPVAAAMPNARVFVADGATSHERAVQTVAAVREFLGAPPEAPSQIATRTSTAGTAIILFADIADSTALTERMGDAAFRAKARALDDALRSVVRDNGGAAIDGKLLGDGILATFPAASHAIAAALTLEAAAAPTGLGLHIGLHAGDVLREHDARGQSNVYGGAVNIASRISALAAPGEVLVSDIVRGLARTSAGVTFEDRGEHLLKGIAEPQRVFAVRATESG